MNFDRHLLVDAWDGYELLDSGENMKLERFGDAIVARPETEALWAKRAPERWSEARATFAFKDSKGLWAINRPLPERWVVPASDIRLSARLTSFKHTGIFPEQAENWDWIKEQTRAIRSGAGGPWSERSEEAHESATSSQAPVAPRVLNLFGYTGGASLAAAIGGAHVTHVDASKQSLDWAHDNARLSGIGEDKIRWILDDALAFAKREVRRGQKYDGIILDPPAFGRGAKGEVWHIEEQLPELLATLKGLLNAAPGSFFLMSGYAAGYSPLSFAQAVESVFGEVDGDAGELRIKESGSDRAVPAGIYVRFVR